MFKPKKNAHGHLLGYEMHKDGILFFFGSRHLPRTQIQSTFPDFEFCFLKQVHGKAIVNADPSRTPEADGQFTDRAKWALISQTADCVPVLLASETRICAIHSGWKGTAQNIVAQAREVFNDEKVKHAAIGPHILSSSFEVGKDVAEQLHSARPTSASHPLTFPHNDANKVYFDLNRLVREQILHALGPQVEIVECLTDTKTSADFHSFRRDREQAQRQYSFVVINR